MKKKTVATIAGVALGLSLTVATAAPASATVSNLFSTKTACETAMRNQQQHGARTDGCYAVTNDGGIIAVGWIFNYYR